jgi:hypothetical protein
MTCPAGLSRGATGGQFWTPNSPVLSSKKLHELGAPLRNRTVDLLLTMDNRKVPSPQVRNLTRTNTSSHQQSQAYDKRPRARIATRSATQFDLVQTREKIMVAHSKQVPTEWGGGPAAGRWSGPSSSCQSPGLAVLVLGPRTPAQGCDGWRRAALPGRPPWSWTPWNKPFWTRHRDGGGGLVHHTDTGSQCGEQGRLSRPV